MMKDRTYSIGSSNFFRNSICNVSPIIPDFLAFGKRALRVDSWGNYLFVCVEQLLPPFPGPVYLSMYALESSSLCPRADATFFLMLVV